MTQTKISAVERYMDSLNSLDREAYVACFAQGAELLDPYGGRIFSGAEGLSKWFGGMESTWETFSMKLIEYFDSGDRLAVRWSTSAVALNGKAASFDGINVFTVDDTGLISRLEGYWDAAQMMAQIS